MLYPLDFRNMKAIMCKYDFHIQILYIAETIKIWRERDELGALCEIGISVKRSTAPMSLLAAIKKLRDCS